MIKYILFVFDLSYTIFPLTELKLRTIEGGEIHNYFHFNYMSNITLICTLGGSHYLLFDALSVQVDDNRFMNQQKFDLIRKI